MSESDSDRQIFNKLGDFSQFQEKVLGSDNKYIGIISAPLTPKPVQPYNTSQSTSQVNQNFHPSPQSFNRAVHQSSHVPPPSFSQRQNFVRPPYNGNNNRVPPQHAQPINSRTEVSLHFHVFWVLMYTFSWKFPVKQLNKHAEFVSGE